MNIEKKVKFLPVSEDSFLINKWLESLLINQKNQQPILSNKEIVFIYTKCLIFNNLIKFCCFYFKSIIKGALNHCLFLLKKLPLRDGNFPNLKSLNT